MANRPALRQETEAVPPAGEQALARGRRAQALQDPLPDSRRRRHGRGRLGEQIETQLPGLHEIAQGRVGRQQALEAPAGGAPQGAEDVFGGQSIAQLGTVVLHWSMQPLSRIRLRRIQLFTVPSGAFSRPATSSNVSP
jgi:hypothetical protein